MLKRITSGENPIYKQALKIKRNGSKTMCLVEGERFLVEAIRSNFTIRTLFIQEENWVQKNGQLLRQFRSNNPRLNIVLLGSSLFHELSINDSPQPILGLLEQNSEDFKLSERGRILCLDSIQNPGNLGTIIRTALGLGFSQVILYNCPSCLNQKVIQSSAGNCLKEQVIQIRDHKLLIDYFQTVHLPIFATSLSSKSQNFSDIKWNKFPDLILVIGNEGNGVQKSILQLANYQIKIPMDNGVESLNAGVAAGILCYFITFFK